MSRFKKEKERKENILKWFVLVSQMNSLEILLSISQLWGSYSQENKLYEYIQTKVDTQYRTLPFVIVISTFRVLHNLCLALLLGLPVVARVLNYSFYQSIKSRMCHENEADMKTRRNISQRTKWPPYWTVLDSCKIKYEFVQRRTVDLGLVSMTTRISVLFIILLFCCIILNTFLKVLSFVQMCEFIVST